MKAIKKYLKKREDAIDFLLKKVKQTNSMAFYHKLRVEIKKLNASLNLLEFYHKDFDRKKTFKPFKTIFGQVGRIREFQIEKSMLTKDFAENDLLSYKKELETFIKKEQLIFFKMIDKCFLVKQKKMFNEISPFIKKINENKIAVYLKKMEKEIDRLRIKKALKISTLHELRKRLKLHYYIQKILDPKKPTDTLRINENLLDLIGEWHDLRTTSDHLRELIHTNELDSKELVQLELIRTKIALESRGLFNKIKKKIVV